MMHFRQGIVDLCRCDFGASLYPHPHNPVIGTRMVIVRVCETHVHVAPRPLQPLQPRFKRVEVKYLWAQAEKEGILHWHAGAVHERVGLTHEIAVVVLIYSGINL